MMQTFIAALLCFPPSVAYCREKDKASPIPKKADPVGQCHLVKKVRFHRIVKPDFFVIIFVKVLDIRRTLCGLFANCG